MSSANPSLQDPSMEEILSSIRRIIADDQETLQGGADKPHAARIVPVDDVLDLAEVAPRPAAPVDLEMPELSFRDERGEPAAAEQARTDRAMTEHARDSSGPSEAGADLAAAASIPRLVSPNTDASVNQAFNMLAHTVLSNNARTLEDLVKEMLRPMLKVWLDDNLPGLVERLVRAEIERVARGGR